MGARVTLYAVEVQHKPRGGWYSLATFPTRDHARDRAAHLTKLSRVRDLPPIRFRVGEYERVRTVRT